MTYVIWQLFTIIRLLLQAPLQPLFTFLPVKVVGFRFAIQGEFTHRHIWSFEIQKMYYHIDISWSFVYFSHVKCKIHHGFQCHQVPLTSPQIVGTFMVSSALSNPTRWESHQVGTGSQQFDTFHFSIFFSIFSKGHSAIAPFVLLFRWPSKRLYKICPLPRILSEFSQSS